MFKYEKSVFINRPQQEVFDFVTDLSNDSKWQSSIESVERVSDGPIGVGSTWRYVTKLLGRKNETEIQMTSYDPPRQSTVKAVGGPIPFENTHKFQKQDSGTLLTFIGQAELGGFFKIAEGLAGKQIEKQIESDAAALKKLLEAG
jgi:carbon monoxide dehydrogenase subunit G